jgi:predicted acetyltransferase
MAEFQAEGRGGDTDKSMAGRAITQRAHTWADPAKFASYVRWVIAEVLEDSPRAEGRVPATTLWWVDGDEYLGRLTIRHRLTPHLLNVGGHIGYDVRPSARRRGHATAMLAVALPMACELGINPALITCDEDNIASRKVIEANGGVLEDNRDGKLRFWAPTC